MTIAAAKKALRAEAAARRAAAMASGRACMAEACERLVAAIGPETPSVFSAYRPIGDEIDPGAAYAALSARGAIGCLPVVVGKGLPLAFRRWREGEPLARGAFGVEIPERDDAATPVLLIVPLLAFDRRGFRLGYGGGFYDRTLAALRAAAPDEAPVRAVGFAFAAQEVEAVPVEPTDMPLDLIVTEDAVLRPDVPA